MPDWLLSTETTNSPGRQSNQIWKQPWRERHCEVRYTWAVLPHSRGNITQSYFNRLEDDEGAFHLANITDFLLNTTTVLALWRYKVFFFKMLGIQIHQETQGVWGRKTVKQVITIQFYRLHCPLKNGICPSLRGGEFLLWFVRFYDIWGPYFLGIQLSNVVRRVHFPLPAKQTKR